ncbi:hypothetical protein EV715DRAFT_295506 [Schizophyllum commune]
MTNDKGMKERKSGILLLAASTTVAALQDMGFRCAVHGQIAHVIVTHLHLRLPALPPIPSVDAHHLLLGKSEQDGWEDFALYVDPRSGEVDDDGKAGTESGSGTAEGSSTKNGSGTDTTITFHAFRQRVAVAATVLARHLEEVGVDVRAEPRPIVGILSENSVTFATVAHALLRLAIPFALLPAHATPYELGHSLRLTGAQAVLVGKG